MADQAFGEVPSDFYLLLDLSAARPADDLFADYKEARQMPRACFSSAYYSNDTSATPLWGRGSRRKFEIQAG
jgi:hypothetical protein